jgi:hypothetical protein
METNFKCLLGMQHFLISLYDSNHWMETNFKRLLGMQYFLIPRNFSIEMKIKKFQFLLEMRFDGFIICYEQRIFRIKSNLMLAQLGIQ